MAAAVSRLIFSCFVLSGTPSGPPLPPGPPSPPGPSPSPATVDYCTTSFCPAGVKNVGCDPPPLTGGLGCAEKNAVVFEIGPVEEYYILSFFLTKREFYASGNSRLTGFDSAARMPMLKWDAELASQAGHKARTCEYTKDACRNTAKYSNVGQVINAYSIVDDGTVHSKSFVLSNLFDMFDIEDYTQSASPYDWGNLIYDKADAIGCAVQQYNEFGSYIYYLVCNLSAASIVGQPLYATGPTASGCTSGRDEAYSSLCSSAEVI